MSGASFSRVSEGLFTGRAAKRWGKKNKKKRKETKSRRAGGWHSQFAIASPERSSSFAESIAVKLHEFIIGTCDARRKRAFGVAGMRRSPSSTP